MLFLACSDAGLCSYALHVLQLSVPEHAQHFLFGSSLKSLSAASLQSLLWGFPQFPALFLLLAPHEEAKTFKTFFFLWAESINPCILRMMSTELLCRWLSSDAYTP